jgi:hypothetical protein
MPPPPRPRKQLLCQVFMVADRLKFRHIPGPAIVPLFGNLLTVAPKHGKMLMNAYTEWRGRYGKVFKWHCGQETYVVMAGAAPHGRGGWGGVEAGSWRGGGGGGRGGGGGAGGRAEGCAACCQWRQQPAPAGGGRSAESPPAGTPPSAPGTTFPSPKPPPF